MFSAHNDFCHLRGWHPSCWQRTLVCLGVLLSGVLFSGCELASVYQAPPAQTPSTRAPSTQRSSTQYPAADEYDFKRATDSELDSDSGSAEADANMNDPEPDSEPESVTGVAAADQLLSQGQGYLDAGNLDAAAGSLERAVRLAPRSGLLYLALAKVRYLQDNHGAAAQLAQRALTLLPRYGTSLEQAARAEAQSLRDSL